MKKADAAGNRGSTQSVHSVVKILLTTECTEFTEPDPLISKALTIISVPSALPVVKISGADALLPAFRLSPNRMGFMLFPT